MAFCNRLAGAALLAPVINYRWPSFPPKLAKAVFSQELPEDQWASRVARYAPWLVYWWNTQKWFPPNSVIAGRANFSAPDLEILSKLDPSSIDMVFFFLSILVKWSFAFFFMQTLRFIMLIYMSRRIRHNKVCTSHFTVT